MTISYTYDSLKTALQDWMEDSFADFTGELDDIIGKAELRCVRDLDLDLFHQVDGSSVTTAAGTTTITLPSDAIMLRTLWVNSVLLEPKSESYCYYYNDLASNGQPLYWCQVTETLVKLSPTPDDAYSTRLYYLRRPARLSSTTSTTFLSTNAGDLLFAACKVLSEQFDKAPEDAAAAEAEYQNILPRAQRELKLLARKDYA